MGCCTAVGQDSVEPAWRLWFTLNNLFLAKGGEYDLNFCHLFQRETFPHVCGDGVVSK